MKVSKILIKNMNYRLDIEGLRGLSVIYVLLYHYYPKTFNGGIFGVDIFFVISGYVITNSLNNRKVSSLYFYQKRVNRIYPAAYICLLWIISNKQFDKTINLLKDIYSAILFIVNFRFYFSSTDYFSNQTSIVLHYWSLSIENQFYIFYPLIIILFYKNVAYILITLLFLSFLHLLANYRIYPEYCYFVTFPRIWEIIAGCLTFHSSELYLKGSSTIRYVISYIFVLLLFPILFVGDIYSVIPGPFTFIPIIIASIICIESKNTYISYILTNWIIRFMGIISYSFYLYHYPIKFINIKIMYKVLITLLISTISYFIIEKPFQKVKLNSQLFFIGLLGVISAMIYCVKYEIKRIENIRNSFIINIKYNECAWIKIRFGGYDSIEYLFLGDSHLEQYHPSLQYFFRKPTLHIYYYFFSLYYHDLSVLENMIKPFKNVKTIVVSFLLRLYTFNKTLNEVHYYIENYMKMLQKYSKTIIFIQDIPYLDFSPHEEYRKGKKTFEIGINASRVLLNLNNKNIVVLNAFDAICPYKICNFTLNNVCYFRDDNHLDALVTKNVVSEYFAKHLTLPSECNNRSKMYICELRMVKFSSKYDLKFAAKYKFKVLKDIYPHPEY